MIDPAITIASFDAHTDTGLCETSIERPGESVVIVRGEYLGHAL